MRGKDFHITQLIQVNVFFRPQFVFFKEVIETLKTPPISAGYVSPKPILLIFGVSAISVQRRPQQINYNVQKQCFYSPQKLKHNIHKKSVQ